MNADPNVLRQRLIDVMAFDPATPFDKLSASEAIRCERLEGAVCARIPAVGGRMLNFGQYFTVLFSETIDGKPWKPKEKK